MITTLLHYIHLFLCILPFIFLLLPDRHYKHKTFKKFFIIYALLNVFVPLHWPLLDGKCFFTMLTDIDDNKYSDTISFLKVINKYTFRYKENVLSNMVYTVWFVIMVVIWYIIFFKLLK